MHKGDAQSKRYLHIVAALLGTALLAYLVVRVGSDKLLENAKTIGWGILLVIGLAGIGHVIKTWAWRLTLPGIVSRVSFSRTLGLRLVSESIGQFGVFGQVLGEATRASLLSSELPASDVLSSVALDRGLFILTGLIVTVAGFVAILFLPAVPARLQLYAGLFGVALLVLVAMSVLAVRRGWPVLSSTAHAFRHVPRLGAWLESKESLILSAETQLLNFHTQTPRRFWGSTALNFAAHGLAIGEVYVILLLMGSKIHFVGALMLEALTKLINAVGAINPGNVGTYEGGNMAIVRLVGLTATAGLTLGLCRRFRSIVWAIIGGICLLYFSRPKQTSQIHVNPSNDVSKPGANPMFQQESSQSDGNSTLLLKVAVILANQSDVDLSKSLLARVGALPLVLRAILSAQSAGAGRIVVVVDPANGSAIRQSLFLTGRLPDSVEWLQTRPDSAIPAAVRLVAPDAERVVLIRGDRSYQPSLYRTAMEWEGDGALELVSDGKLIGLVVLSHDLAHDLTRNNDSYIANLEDLHEWIRVRHVSRFGPTVVYCEVVPEETWQSVATEQDRLVAEEKLDRWLVKPTDGIFARMNRRISIPISRQLIKFPITANMVTMFTLGVSVASGVYFALGGYWNMIIGAVLSVWASILDGCDGEVARLKLQSSAFGCWLETVCDYLYYLLIFGGMTIGLTRSWNARRFLVWGAALFIGAITTFLVAGLLRQRLSGQHPEQCLAVWQKKAESRLSNPLMYVGRYCEFILRRCFLPYALLALALFNFMPAALYASAIGANVAWIIALYSYIAFTRKKHSAATPQAAVAAPATNALAI